MIRVELPPIHRDEPRPSDRREIVPRTNAGRTTPHVPQPFVCSPDRPLSDPVVSKVRISGYTVIANTV